MACAVRRRGPMSFVVGATAPAATLVTLDGQTLATADLVGQVVILTFWATWCAPCRDELPLLSRYAAEHAAAGLRVLGFSLDQEDKFAEIRKVAQTLSFPVGLLSRSSAPGYGRIWRLPVNFTIDRKGKLADDGWKDKNPVSDTQQARGDRNAALAVTDVGHTPRRVATMPFDSNVLHGKLQHASLDLVGENRQRHRTGQLRSVRSPDW